MCIEESANIGNWEYRAEESMYESSNLTIW